MIEPIIIIFVLCGYFIQTKQIDSFLREYSEDSLGLSIALSFSTCVFIILIAFLPNNWERFIFGVMFLSLFPLLVLDFTKNWLPLRFTNVFWLNGILTSALPYSNVNLFSAIVLSIVVFIILRFLCAKLDSYYGREALGRGDIHLIAGCFAWFSLDVGLNFIGSSFIVMAIAMTIKRGKELPYAPFLILTISIFFVYNVLNEVLL
ncbi:prepilin peptidase [Hafnia paralvei]|uniref:prepilin peptidase n=1 Tax=Hafnia paralvei TaxID=546367 RepID=UPI002FDBF03D